MNSPIDELIYDALRSDTTLMEVTGGRIISTCTEVAPYESDNTPLPYMIITYDGMQVQDQTKDDIYDGGTDVEEVSVEICTESRTALFPIIKRIRKVVRDYFLNTDGDCPDDYTVRASGVNWDWEKPCYFQTLTFQTYTEYEQD